jgi:hypothetical protein
MSHAKAQRRNEMHGGIRIVCASAPLRGNITWLITAATLVLSLLRPSWCSAKEPVLRVKTGTEGKPVAVEVAGLSEQQSASLRRLAEDDPQWTKLLGIYVASAAVAAGNTTAVAGAYRIDGDTLRFTPRFAFLPGTSYRAALDLPPAGPATGFKTTLDIQIPALPTPPATKVTAIYPSSSVLPENQLRFYLHFSQPMNAGDERRRSLQPRKAAQNQWRRGQESVP